MVDVRREMVGDTREGQRLRCRLVVQRGGRRYFRARDDAAVAQQARARGVLGWNRCRFTVGRFVGASIDTNNAIGGMNKADHHQDDGTDEPPHRSIIGTRRKALSSFSCSLCKKREGWSNRVAALRSVAQQRQRDRSRRGTRARAA